MSIERAKNRYHYQSAAIDLSAAAATTEVVWIPRTGTLLRAAFVIAEAIGAGADTAAVQVGYADADGGNDDVDYYVLGTTNDANGLITASGTVGTTQELTLQQTTLTAGKCLTISHLQDVDVTGVVRVILEFEF